MKNDTLKFLAAGVLVTCCFFFGSLSFAAQGRIVDDVEIVTTSSGTEIHIFFNDLFQYVTHTPPAKGDDLQVQLQPVSSSLGNLEAISLVENVTWKPVAGVPLLEIAYDGTSLQGATRISASTRPMLRVRFERPVAYSVQGAPDLRGIVILLPEIIPAPKAPVATPEPPVSALPKVIEPTKEKKIKEVKTSIPAEARFVLQIHSSQIEIPRDQLPSHALLEQYIVYKTSAIVDGVTWYRWRLGFFMTEDEAKRAMRDLKQSFPEAWIVKVPETEHREYYRPVAAKTEPPSPGEGVLPEREVRPLPLDRLNAMLEEAKQVMTAGDYQRAIQLYTRILQHPDPQLQKDALEYLALARERNGQPAHAKALYEEYLTRYPKEPGAVRVEQRLVSLLSARSLPKDALRKGRTVSEEKTWEKEFFGSLSEFYDFDESKVDDTRSTNTSALTSDVDMNLRLRSKEYDIQTSFVGSNTNDFTEESRDEARVSQLYADVLDRKRDFSLRAGRQSENSGGILGRFDGSIASYKITPTIKVNGVYGYPVASPKQSEVDTDRAFWGVNFDLGTYASHWDFNTFYIEQEADGITDRQAIGGEARYFEPRRSLFSLVDYDIFIDQLNTFLLVGSATVFENTLLRANYDFRRSNILSASSALQGQSVERIADLLLLNTEDEIRRLAEERGADQQTISIGVTQPLSQKWQIDGEVSRAQFSDTLDLDGITSTPGSEDYYYNVQMIGNGLIKEGDVAIFSIRYDDTEASNTIYLTADGRYPITRDLRFNPRLRWDFRDSKNGTQRYRWSPLVRFDYRLNRHWRLELDAGLEATRQETAVGATTEIWRDFISIGFRLIF